MSYNISSNELSHPLLKELLRELTYYFDSIDSEFYVIGATARDIILSGIHDQKSKRSTADLDIAIAIKDWSKFDKIANGLCNRNDFHKSSKQKQLFWYKKDFKLDIVPFGEVAKADQNIYWPPEEQFAMSVVGFTEVARQALEVTIDDEFTIRVASLPGIVILKLAAFNDRKLQSDKDADDIAFIINNYLDINGERAATKHYDIYENESFDSFIAGATLLGRDIKTMLGDSNQTLNTFIEILENEVALEEESLLINQVVETHKIKYDIVFEAIQAILNQVR